MMKIIFLLPLLCTTLAQEDPCPLEKTVDGISYTLVKEDVDTSSFGCQANCTYQPMEADDESMETVCFEGDTAVTIPSMDSWDEAVLTTGITDRKSEPRYPTSIAAVGDDITVVIAWRFGMRPLTLTVRPGTKVKFVWPKYERFNVVRVSEKEFDTCETSRRPFYDQPPFYFHAKFEGDYYFIDSTRNGANCRSGMKAKIIVKCGDYHYCYKQNARYPPQPNTFIITNKINNFNIFKGEVTFQLLNGKNKVKTFTGIPPHEAATIAPPKDAFAISVISVDINNGQDTLSCLERNLKVNRDFNVKPRFSTNGKVIGCTIVTARHN